MKLIGIDAFSLGRSHYTGKENYILSLINGLLKTRIDLKYEFFLPKNSKKIPSISGENVEFVFSPATSSYTKWNQLILPFILKNKKLDIIIFTESMLPIIRFSSNCKKILIIHDVMYLHVKKEFDSKTRYLLHSLMPHSLKKADVIVTNSEASKTDIVHFYKCPEEKICVVPPSLEIKKNVLNMHLRNSIFEKFNITSRYITYVGNHAKYKNLFRLLEAFKMVCSDQGLDDYKLLLIGQIDENTHSLIQKTKELGIEKKVIITGYISNNERDTLLQGTQLLILPSLYEGFGIPLIEAMAMGVSVVTSNISSMPEVVGDAGLTFNPKNINEMVMSIKKILLNNDLKLSLIQKGYERVKNFDQIKSAYKFNFLIDNILS